jgi:hypothetical protein
MKPGHLRQYGKGGLELIEEAVHLLRMASGGALAAYYIGSLPFILGLLYFWADMSRSPFARQHLTGAALGLALLFLWMKFWQAIFANQLRAQICSLPPPRWNVGKCWRILLIQTAVHPSGLFLLPLSLVLGGLPLAWFYAFYQNVTALTDGETAEVRAVFKRSYKQSLLWPGQNLILLVVLLAFGFCVFLNLATVCFTLPQLCKTLFGIESAYTQSPFSLINTTFLAAVAGLAYLCVDPIVKAVYLLRCFYGESLQSGEDLKAELRHFSSVIPMAANLILLLVLVAAPANAADSPAPATGPDPASNITPPALDRAIEDVIHQPKYTWRMPREKVIEDDTASDGPLTRFFRSVLKTIKHWIKAVLEWIGDLLDRLFRNHRTSSDKSGFGWISSLQGLVFVLLVVLACALAVFLFRAFQRSRSENITVASEAILPIPDISDENVGAEQLPEDGWTRLGRELLGRGELRLALRAFYFASLAHLSARNLITIARFKSNRDYERELGRRGHALPGLVTLFGENVGVFDRSWYGLHEVNDSLVGQFVANVERIKGQ